MYRAFTVWYARILSWLLALSVAVLIIPVSLQIFSRYTQLIPAYIWTEEMARFLFIWMVMIGMILVTIDRRHIALDFLVNRLAPRPRIALTMFHHLIIAIGAAYAAVQSLEFAQRVAMIGQTSMAIGFPMVFAHSALVVGFAATALVAAVLVVSGGTELVSLRRATKAELP